MSANRKNDVGITNTMSDRGKRDADTHVGVLAKMNLHNSFTFLTHLHKYISCSSIDIYAILIGKR